LFSRPIERDIQGVIKVGQAENVKQELEEYVVTRELLMHFSDFFSNYRKGINSKTDKVGVWISGFFGSGKSHFLKILSYLLENREVDGKRALDYFVDDNKITDPMIIADIRLANQIPTDVILFNIDSKSDATGKRDERSLISVYLKVFNEMRGFCGSNPWVADLENELSERALYQQFQDRFLENYGAPWVESRLKFYFIQDILVETLVDIGAMSEDSARNFCERAINQYSISIEDFVKKIEDYLKKKGNNHHIVFFVDEVGQYIGDNSRMMLNLQTLTEELGKKCQGRVWNVVTSQQDVDSVINELRKDDFSKIQGRFDTKISLSSANVDEVIKKRILEKTETASDTLKLLYQQKETEIRNKIIFDGPEKRLYSDEREFAEVYPFIPYQFNLVGSVLTSIRTHGASGKHLSEGERSMLALFKESAMKIMDEDINQLVPFNLFYDSLHQFLDHNHKGVIIKALNNTRINPEGKEDCFLVKVLKTLFLIKYVKEIDATIENITSLLIPSIDADRFEIKKQVEEALDIFVSETLVERNGDIYIFLTDEEQEINREIHNQKVEISDIVQKTSELIFDDIFSENKYKYPKFSGRYVFGFNQYVDGRPHKYHTNNEIGLHIITPKSELSGEEINLRMLSQQRLEVIVSLPNDRLFLEELTLALKIEKFLRTNSMSNLPNYQQIREIKNKEMNDRIKTAKFYLEEALKNADIYVNGDRLEIKSKDIKNRFNEALGRLINTVFFKLSYITAAVNEYDIKRMLEADSSIQLDLKEETETNSLALEEVLNFITNSTSKHSRISLKSIKDKFLKAPYGFIDDDVEWMVAKLFNEGKISLYKNGESISKHTDSIEDIIRYLARKEFVDRILIEVRETPPENQLRAVKIILKDLFEKPEHSDDSEKLENEFKRCSNDMLNELKTYKAKYENKKYPGKAVIDTGISLISKYTGRLSQKEFFRTVFFNQNELLNFTEDYSKIKNFFESNQKEFFDQSLKILDIFDTNRNYINDKEIEELAKMIREITNLPEPYSEIVRLPELNERFESKFCDLLEKMSEPVKMKIKTVKESVLSRLEGKPFKDELEPYFDDSFKKLFNKADTTNNISELFGLEREAETLRARFINLIKEKEEILDSAKEWEETKQKRKIKFNIKQLLTSKNWEITKPEDLDYYLYELRDKILSELDDDTIVNIEF